MLAGRYRVVSLLGQGAMEYVDGENLSSLLARIGRLTPDKALDIARDLSTGLAAIHESGIVHRDLKPANIMIDGRGRARITDFGLAVGLETPGTQASAGTPSYKSPERWNPVLNARPGPFRFFYRDSSGELIAGNRDAVVKRDDPPIDVPGMAEVVLDARGPLMKFVAVPPLVEPSEGPWPEPDWHRSFVKSSWTPRAL